MHSAQVYAAGTFSAAGGPPSVPLTAKHAQGMALALNQDAANYSYSAAVSIVESLQAIDRGLFSWATVKLYYSTFYLARAFLALDGFGLLYFNGSKPYAIRAIAGATFAKRNGNTHKVVLDLYEQTYPTSPYVQQQIAMLSPFAWMMKRREQANYTDARFCEPTVPDHMLFVAQKGIRQSVGTYLEKRNEYLQFDPDHAMLALPLNMLKNTLSRQGPGLFSSDESEFLREMAKDRSGPIANMRGLFP